MQFIRSVKFIFLQLFFIKFPWIRCIQQSPELLLIRHSGGQVSSLDMAQYVFWTGDEEGVARAVEEFIQKGLVTISLPLISNLKKKQTKNSAADVTWECN